MEINRSKINTIYEHIKGADKNKIKHLDQEQRAAILNIMSAIQEDREKANINLTPEKMNNLELYLKTKVIDIAKPESSLIDRVLKGIKNKFGSRVGSSKLQRAFNKADRKIKSQENELRKIKEKIKGMPVKIEEFKVSRDYFKDFLIDVYQDMDTFYKNLDEDFSKSAISLREKIEKINNTVNEINSSNDPNKKDKLHTYNNEVLKNLNDVLNLKDKDSWPRELKANKNVWGNSAKNTQKGIETLNEEINNSPKELEKLRNEKERIEKLLLGLSSLSDRGPIENKL